MAYTNNQAVNPSYVGSAVNSFSSSVGKYARNTAAGLGFLATSLATPAIAGDKDTLKVDNLAAVEYRLGDQTKAFRDVNPDLEYVTLDIPIFGKADVGAPFRVPPSGLYLSGGSDALQQAVDNLGADFDKDGQLSQEEANSFVIRLLGYRPGTGVGDLDGRLVGTYLTSSDQSLDRPVKLDDTHSIALGRLMESVLANRPGYNQRVNGEVSTSEKRFYDALEALVTKVEVDGGDGGGDGGGGDGGGGDGGGSGGGAGGSGGSS